MIHRPLTIPSVAWGGRGAGPLRKTMMGAMAGLLPPLLDPPMCIVSITILDKLTICWTDGNY